MLKNIFIAIRKKSILVLFIGITASILSCGGSDPSNSDTIIVSGKVTYDRVPDTEGGLDYTAIFQLPVRRALVSAKNANSGSILQNTYTDNSGNYSISVPVNTSVVIYVYAQTQNPIIVVQDNNTSSASNLKALYSLKSSAFTTNNGENITKNLNAASGYNSTTQKLSENRAAAPFAILDNCLQASDFFLENRSIDFPKLVVNWSEKNSSRVIGTSHWDNFESELYILGDADVDTDEYDQHVIVHEWGHYFESSLGRSDSLGGAHTDGDVLDPRVAFSEGWGNALSAMVLYPDSVYKDTGGLNQSTTGILFDIEKNNTELAINSQFKIGWFSEGSVQAILYDIFDPDNGSESWDQISSNSGVVYDIYTNFIKNTESLTTIFTFLDAYLKINPSDASNVDLLIAKHNMTPIVDEFGTGETNNGGIFGALPVYKSLGLGEQVVLGFSTVEKTNFLGNYQYLKVSGVSGRASISATGGSSKTITLVHKGVELMSSSGSSTISISNFNFDFSKTYIVVVKNNLFINQITVSLNP